MNTKDLIKEWQNWYVMEWTYKYVLNSNDFSNKMEMRQAEIDHI